jgi:hypothetical protein
MLPEVLKTSSGPASRSIRSIRYGARTFRLAGGGAGGRNGKGEKYQQSILTPPA